MDNIFDLGRKRETVEEEGETEKLLTELNAAFSKDILEATRKVEDRIKDRLVVMEGVMGNGVKDFVIASILLYHAAYFLNKLTGTTLVLNYELKLKNQEVENLASLLLLRLMRVERARFDATIAEKLKETELFRRLRKKAMDNGTQIKTILKRTKKNNNDDGQTS